MEGIDVEQGKLLDYFSTVETISRAKLLRKGRVVKLPDLIDIHPGARGYLSDIITLKPGMVPPEKHKVLIHETLLCDGQGNCRRLCGGQGCCLAGCKQFNSKRNLGHFCSFSVKLMMYTNTIGTWYVQIRGSHVGPDETWLPPNVSPLRNPLIREQYRKAFDAGFTSYAALQAAVDVPERAEKSQLITFIRTLKRKQKKGAEGEEGSRMKKIHLEEDQYLTTPKAACDIYQLQLGFFSEDSASESGSETPNGTWQIGKVSYIAIACPDLDKAISLYRDVLQAKISKKKPHSDHGVTTVSVELGDTKIELLHPLGATSPVKNFLEKHPDGGLHHICLKVDNIMAAIKNLKGKNIRTLSDTPSTGYRGKPVIFLHPKDCSGVLVQLEES